MLLEGIVTYILRDKNTGEVKYENKLKNTLTRSAQTTDVIPDRLVISTHFTNNNPASFYQQWLYNCDLGIDIPGLPRREGPFVDSSPIYTEWRQRFPAPAADRTIYSIAITNDTSLDLGSYYNAIEPFAYVNLTTPCVQTTSEILDIFYTIRFIDDGPVSQTSASLETLARIASDSNIAYPRVLTGTFLPNVKSSIDLHNKYVTNFQDFEQLSGFIDSFNAVTGRTTWNYENVITSNIGRVVGTFALMNNSTSTLEGFQTFHQNARQPSDPKVQSIIPHGSSATLPFFDALNDAAGDGIITIDDSSWGGNNFPEMYRIDIDTTGPVGTSTYKFGVRNFLGFVLNNYRESYNAIPYFFQLTSTTGPIGDNPIEEDELDMEGIVVREYIMDDPRVLVIKSSLLMRLNIITGERERWGNNHGTYGNNNGLPATFITQVEVDTVGNIWVACRDTGLYQISADGLSISFFDATSFGGVPVLSNNCYGVDIGNGKIWAAFEGGLAYSSDGGSSWTSIDQTTTPAFVEATINGDWSRIRYIRADRSSATDDIAVIASLASNYNYIVWWSLSNPTTSIYSNYITTLQANQSNSYTNAYNSADTVTRYNRRVIVSDQGTWAACVQTNRKIEFINHGSTTPANVVTNSDYNNVTASSYYTMQFVLDKNGNEAILTRNSSGAPSLAYPNGNLVIPGAGTEQTYSWTASQAADEMENYFCHIGSGVVISPYGGSYYNGLAVQCLSERDQVLGGEVGEAILWKFYGWNGSAWVLNDPGSKTTHSGLETLHNGLTISFDNNGDQFVAGDYYTTAVLDGILIDGTLEFDYRLDSFRTPFETTTDFEPNIVTANQTALIRSTPAVTYQSDYLQGWQDTIAATVTSDTVRTTITTLEPTFPTAITGRARSNATLDGDFNLTFTHYEQVETDRTAFIFGLIDPSNIGNAHVDDSHITHGIFFDYSTATPQIHVRESGVNVYTWPEPLDFNLPVSYWYNTFSIVRRDTQIQYFYRGVLLYTSLVSSVGSQHAEVLINGRGGIYMPNLDSYISRVDHAFGRSFSDYFVHVGNSTLQTGAFDPNFQKIEDVNIPNFVDIKIDGNLPTSILENDLETPLATGEISIFRDTGIIRFSPSDLGKSITGKVLYIKSY